jgi:chemotaxis protein CheX
MNAVIIARESLNAELSELVKKNGVTAVKNVKNVNMVEAKLSGDKNIAIYDWTGAMEEDMNAVKELVKIDEKYNLKVLLLVDEGIKDAIRLLVKYENVKYIFKPITKERLQIGLRMLLAEKKPPPDINIEYINPFIEATKSIFKQMAFTDLVKKGVNIDRGLTVRGDLSGVMALSGEASGFVIISMGTETAFELVKKMTMGNAQENESEIIEGGVMEIINVISGQAQSMFNQNKYHFDFTTPTMIKGKGHSINHGVTANSIVVRFETREGKEIFLQVCLKHAGTSEK